MFGLGTPGRLLATGEGDEVSKRDESSVLEGGRNAGPGELGRWRAAISRKTATEIRCELSEATLFPLGRTGGVLNGLESAEGGRGTSTTGESDPTCRNDLRLNEAAERSTLSSGGGGGGFDLLRPLAQARNPPFLSFLPFRSFSEFGVSLLLWPSTLCAMSRELLREWEGFVGKDLVECAPGESEYAENRADLDSGGLRLCRSPSDMALVGECTRGGCNRGESLITVWEDFLCPKPSLILLDEAPGLL